MKIIGIWFLLFSVNIFAIENGDQAYKFSLNSAENKIINLKDYTGKVVVLEWLNHGCPFVRKHYDSKNMQKLQERYTKLGIIWLSIISSGEGKQGFSTPEAASEDKKNNGSYATQVLLDVDGKVGKSYDAKTTPHMFIINPQGQIAYQGAIDSVASADFEDLATAENFIAKALDEIVAGKKISVAKTKSYGCSIKYSK